MAWSITAIPYPNQDYPGMTQISIESDGQQRDVRIMREEMSGSERYVRGTHQTDPTGLLTTVDAEAPFTPFRYQLKWDGRVRATSDIIKLPSSGYPLLRVVLTPNVAWTDEVSIVDVVGITHETRTSRYPIIGSRDVITVADKRQRENGTYVFLVENMSAGVNLVDNILLDGIPVLVRTPCSNIRDRVVVFSNVTEERFGTRGKRLFYADFQEIAWPDGVTDVPPVLLQWTYSDISIDPNYPSYADILGSFVSYRTLYDKTPI